MDDALYRLHAQREETYWWWVAKNRIILSLIERYAPRSGRRGRALDIGCGAGGVLRRLSERFDAFGVDSSDLALEYVRARGLMALSGSLPDRLPRLPGADGNDRFDVIVMSEVVEHVPDDRASIRSATALLNPGGILVCTVPAHAWLWSSHDDFNHHQRRYTRRGFASLFDAMSLETLVCSQYQCASMPLLLAVRWGERVRTRLTGSPPHEPDVRELPGWINQPLRWGFELEKHWLPHARLPWGSSIISVHRRRPEPAPTNTLDQK